MARSKISRKELPVHPLAAVFPLMIDDELAELAEDIKANGLVHPIVLGDWLDDQEQPVRGIIDGRNRLRACEIAQVEPQFTELNGQDPRAFIVSVNLARRNLSKGQQAMLLAMVYPEPEKGGRGNIGAVKEAKKLGGFSYERLRQARFVLHNAPYLANLVVAGGKSLDEAYTDAQKRRSDSASEEEKMARLRAELPQVADLVIEERISLTAGLAELEEHKRQERMLREAGRKSAGELASFPTHVLNIIGATQLGEDLLDAEMMKLISESVDALDLLWKETHDN